jgi:hypothetical protein
MVAAKLLSQNKVDGANLVSALAGYRKEVVGLAISLNRVARMEGSGTAQLAISRQSPVFKPRRAR